MPQMQTIFASWAYISGERASIKNILKLIKNFDLNNKVPTSFESLNFERLSLFKIFLLIVLSKSIF